VSDDDYFVQNAVEGAADDLDADEKYELLTEAERTAALLWVLDQRIRSDGIAGWIETHGRRSDDALSALALVAAKDHAAPLRRAFALIPTKDASDPDTRLSAMDSWSSEQATVWRRAEDDYLALTRRDNLVDNYVRAFVVAHQEDFPASIEDL
jgi:hypothetical protein